MMAIYQKYIAMTYAWNPTVFIIFFIIHSQ